MARKKRKNPFIGRWRIIDTELWDQDALDLVVPAHITFDKNGLGEMEFIALGASIDYRVSENDDVQYVEFSWSGYDENEPSCGRGWAYLDDNQLEGKIFIHQGDESTFIAKKDT